MLNRLRLRLRSLLFDRRLEREMREEMTEHLSRATDRLVREGLAPDEAARQARRELGNIESLREEARDARGGRGFESLRADLGVGLRRFAHHPVSTLTMVVVLALGLGFTTALDVFISAFVGGALPGVASDASLVRIRGGERSAGRTYTVGREFSYPEYRAYADETRVFGGVAAWTSADVTLDVGIDGESLHSGAATFVTPNYFQVLGVRPIAGAGLPAPDVGSSGFGAVISHVVWDRFYDRAGDVIGRTLKVNGVSVTITAVAPRRFNGARTGGSQIRVWLPLGARSIVQRAPASDLLGYDARLFGLVARLQPGVSIAETQPAVQAIAANAAGQMASVGNRDVLTTDVAPVLAGNYFPTSAEVQEPSRGIVQRLVPLLVPLIVLSITGTTVSALQAGLAVARRREIAVRLALGASRRRIVRQLLTENVVLAMAAAALAVFVIWALLRAFDSRVPDLSMTIEWRTLALTGGLALIVGVLVGLSPALHATRVSLSDVLKDGAGAVAPSHLNLQAGLVVLQIAVTQPALLAMGALGLEMVKDLRRMPSAVHADRILEARFNTNPRYGQLDDRREQTLARLRTRFEAVPGVLAVVPQENGGESFEAATHPSDRVGDVVAPTGLIVAMHAAPAGYFELMSMPIVRGRGLRPGDDEGAVVIGAELAGRLWGDADPLGRRIDATGFSRPGRLFTVVGVVDEPGDGRGGEVHRVFVPAPQVTSHFLIRTQEPAELLVQAIRSAANSEAPDLPLISLSTLAANENAERQSFVGAIAAAAGGGAVALLLSTIGLYAVVSFAVGQRVREIGIRTALGADHRRIVWAFLRRGLSLSVAGVCVGLALSFVVVRVVAAATGEEPPAWTAGIAAMVAIAVTAVALLATWIPARRATRIDPVEALRAE